MAAASTASSVAVDTFDSELVGFVIEGDPDEIERYWAGLADGAIVKRPLAASSWAPLYGMLTDRFGVTWVLDTPRRMLAEHPALGDAADAAIVGPWAPIPNDFVASLIDAVLLPALGLLRR